MISLIRVGFLRMHLVKKAIILKVITNLLLTLTFISIWKVIYFEGEFVLSLEEFVMYSILSMVISSVYSLDVVSIISSNVKSGNIIFYLNKPRNIVYQLFFESLGKSFFQLLYIGLPSFLILSFFYRSFIRGGKIIEIFLVLIFSYILLFLIEVIFGFLSIFSLNSWGLQSFKYSMIVLLSGQFMPLSMYPETLKKIVDILPFEKLYSYPILVFLGKEEFHLGFIIEYFTIFILFGLLAYILGKIVLKRVMVNGG